MKKFIHRSNLYEKLHSLAQEIDVDVVSVYFFNKSKGSLTLFCSYGLNEESWGSEIPINRGLVGKCAREMKPISIKNPMNHPDFYYLPNSGEEIYKTFIGIPIVEKSNLLGVMVIQTVNMRHFSVDDINKMCHIAYHHIPEIYDEIFTKNV